MKSLALAVSGIAASLWLTLACTSGAVAAPADQAQAAAQSPSQSPAETVAVTQARRLLDAAKGDDASFLATLEQIWAVRRVPPKQFVHARSDLAAYDFHAVESATPTQAVVSAYDPETEVWVRLSFTVQAEAPHAIVDVQVHDMPRPADVPPPPKLEAAALAAATQAMADRLAAADRFSGAVLIGKDDGPVLEKAWGLADRNAHTPNAADTQFREGSLTKMFTAVAIMQLAQAGKLDLDAPIGRYLPDFPNQQTAAKVIINTLLTYTDGTGNFYWPDFDARHPIFRDAKDYIAVYGRTPIGAFEPGTRQAFTTLGFVVLGRIVEEVSGQSYDDYVREHIFAPAQMDSTGMEPETATLPRRAVAYMKDKASGRQVNALVALPYRGTPAGGGYSTVGDLFRFTRALLSNKLLDAPHTKLLTTGGATLSNGTFYSYDFEHKTPNGRRYMGYGEGSASSGQSAVVRIFPQSGYIVVVLANRDPPIATLIADFISERVP
jgi:D-alanyl-D-alanine carboxypeptidase